MYSQVVKTKTRKQPGRPAGPRDSDLETIQNEIVAQTESQHLEDWVSVDCPYCGEGIDVHVTSEQDGQSLYEDCGVCCRPVSLWISVEDDEFQVEACRS